MDHITNKNRKSKDKKQQGINVFKLGTIIKDAILTNNIDLEKNIINKTNTLEIPPVEKSEKNLLNDIVEKENISKTNEIISTNQSSEDIIEHIKQTEQKNEKIVLRNQKIEDNTIIKKTNVEILKAQQKFQLNEKSDNDYFKILCMKQVERIDMEIIFYSKTSRNYKRKMC
jgi:hypothetical protein